MNGTRRAAMFATLRRQAEALLQESGTTATELSLEDTQHLLHELETYQIELELQNEELHRTQQALEAEIAERKHIEQQFRLQARMLDAIGQAVIAVAADGSIIYWNRAAETLYGWSADEVRGCNILEVTPSVTSSTQAARIMDCLRTGEPWSGEFRVTHRDGTEFMVLVSDVPLYDENGTLLGAIGVSTDITEQRHVAEALRQSEERYRLVSELVSDVAYSFRIEADGMPVLEWMTDASERITGVAPDDVATGDRWGAPVHPDDLLTVQESYQHVLQGRSDINEFRITTPQGEVRWLCEHNQSIWDAAQGRVVRVYGAAQDITERKRAEEALRVQRDLAVALSATSDLTEALNHVLVAVLQLNEIDCGGVYLMDRQAGMLHLAVHRGLSAEFVQHVACYGATDPGILAVMEGAPVYVRMDDERIPRGEMCQAEGLRALASLPVLYEEQVVAVLNLASHTHDEIAANTCTALEAIVAQIGGVIARLEMETALRESRMNLQTLFETLHDFLFVIDAEGRLLHVNPVVVQRLDHPAEHLVGMPIHNLHPPEQADEVRDVMRTILTGTAHDCYFPLVTRNGRQIPVETRCTRGTWNHQDVMFCISRDITERKRAEEALRQAHNKLEQRVARRTAELTHANELLEQSLMQLEQAHAELSRSEARSRALLQAIPDAMFVFQRDGLVLDFKSDISMMSGIPDEQIVGKNWRDIVSPPLGNLLGTYGDQALATGDMQMFEYAFEAREYEVRLTVCGTDQILAVVRDITERIQAIEALKQNQALLQGILYHTPAAIFVKDNEGRYLLVNQAAAAAVHLSPEQMIGKTDDDLFAPELTSVWHTQEHQVCLQGEPQEFEECIVQEDGTHTYLATSFPIYDAQGQIYAIGGIMTDITGRTRAEEALRESEERFRQLAENIQQVFWIRDVTTQQRFYISPAFEQVWGISCSNLYANWSLFLDAVHPDDQERVQAAYQQHHQSGGFNEEYRIVRPDGTLRWIWARSFPIRDDEGMIYRLAGIAEDITERKQAEQALAHAYNDLAGLNTILIRRRNLLRAIFDNLDDGLLLLDSAGIVQEVNQPLAALLGSTPEQFVGQPWRMLYPQLAPGFPGYVAFTTPPGGRQHTRRRYRLADGTTRVLDLQTIVLPGPDETVDQVILHVVDVTDMLQLHALVIENERFAASGRLAASVAHEINTPLQALQNALKLLQIAPEDEKDTFWHYAQQEMQRVGRIVRQLLDLYRPSASVPGPVQVNELLERILLLIGKQLRDQGVTVEQELEPDLPAVWGRGDELLQVLLNLVVNALEAMPEGGRLTVQTAAQSEQAADNEGVVITVADTGGGIAAGLQTTIFEPFVTTKEDGTGLGLSISQQIVQQHGGHIDLESVEGEGCQFAVVLPVRAPNSGEESHM